ncbi:MAG TPA: hypothetical protein VE007_06210 [Thermoanaerobaculia bacterium]|nr:hypothetical protein [Thermoanaerobaculia bacterium]
MTRKIRFRSLVLAAGLPVLALFAAGCPGTYVVSSGPVPDDVRYSHPYYPPPGADYGYAREQFARLAHELDDRAARAHHIAERRAASWGPDERRFFERIHHFSDEASSFHDRYESGDIRTRADLRASMEELIRDARATDRAIRDANVFPEVWNEWAGVIATLQRMIDMVR